MNSQEFKMYGLVTLHTVIWLVALFGGIVFGKDVALFNILAFLPAIYIFQSLPVHLILKEKIEFVLANKQHLRKKEHITYSKRGECDDAYVSKVTGIPLEDVIESYKYITYYEDKFFLNDMNRKLAYMFSNMSYMNPLSPQGLIILAFIVNAYYLKFKTTIL
jgi:hypothetical protein